MNDELFAATPPLPRRLGRHAFNRPTLQVARDLLGKFIVRQDEGRRFLAMVTEVEAYKGPRDRASHAWRGRRTTRVEPLYRDGGTVYVYLCYGIHWMLNFSTAGEGNPEGLLVRGIVSYSDAARMLMLGPGKVTRYLHIDKTLDGVNVEDSKAIWLEDRGVRLPAARVRSGPRIGIDFAGPYWAARRWRFWIETGLDDKREIG